MSYRASRAEQHVAIPATADKFRTGVAVKFREGCGGWTGMEMETP